MITDASFSQHKYCISMSTQCGIAQFLTRGKKKKGIRKKQTNKQKTFSTVPQGNQKEKLN